MSDNYTHPPDDLEDNTDAPPIWRVSVNRYNLHDDEVRDEVLLNKASRDGYELVNIILDTKNELKTFYWKQKV